MSKDEKTSFIGETFYSYENVIVWRRRFMDVFEAIQQRRSIRAYEPTAVPKEKLNRILEAAQMAPSASNIQPWHFIVVTDSEKRKKLAEGGSMRNSS